MALKDDSFPGSAAFDTISTAFASDETERENAIKAGGAVYSFTLVNKDGKQESWYMDLKKEGKVGKGAAPTGGKPDVSIRLADETFASIVSGQAQAKSLFMRGKIKVKGNFIKATKLDSILGQTKAKL
ncbi:putative lipid transfer protein [Aspergillus pseudoustus]|uniref:Lipid transfer protein n=1 Tax=Aspergillus pseudoustus TaxID=1810923 RepID=A0ABR4JB88_9EURO